ncbi:MAG: trypsin-like peptidase domain-containing protein [Tepidiforma sp.]
MRGRLLFALLAAAALAAAACGGDSDDDPTPTPAATSAATPGVNATLTPQQIVEKLSSSVVRIRATYPEGVGGGSGVVWEDGRHMLTNAHVVLGAGAIKVVDPKDGREVSAKVVALSPCDDVALLEVDRGNFTPAPIGDSDKVEPGEEVVALGYPGTFTDQGSTKLVVTRGIVSKVHDTFDGLNDLIQTDAAINPGNSGGPLVNSRGEVIGINTLGFRGKQAQNYAIAVNEAKFVADKLRAGKNLNYIGVRLEQNYRGLAQELGIQLAYIDGLVITGVDAGSPADQAGLGYSDLVYYVDSVWVETVGEFCDVLRSRKAGDTIRIDITRTYRDGSHEDLYANVTLK